MTDENTHRQSIPTYGGSDNDDEDLVFSEASTSSRNVKEIVIAGVLAALSIAMTPIAMSLPRVPGGWGIAFFDPTSLFWLVAFLVAGPRAGFISMGAGAAGLLYFDPTGIGPFFKIMATLPMILIPWIVLRLSKTEFKGRSLSDLRVYVPMMIGAFVLRLAVMIPLNLFIVPVLAPGIFTFEQVVIYVIIINGLQSIWDAVVPYVIVHVTPIFEHFGIW